MNPIWALLSQGQFYFGSWVFVAEMLCSFFAWFCGYCLQVRWLLFFPLECVLCDSDDLHQ